MDNSRAFTLMRTSLVRMANYPHYNNFCLEKERKDLVVSKKRLTFATAFPSYGGSHTEDCRMV